MEDFNITFPPYEVYVKVDDLQRIVAINSSEFLNNTTGWVKIDEGYGDKYHHAQGNYFSNSIVDERNIYRYKMVDGKPVERTQSEMDADYVPVEPHPTDSERLDNVEAALAAFIGGVEDV